MLIIAECLGTGEIMLHGKLTTNSWLISSQFVAHDWLTFHSCLLPDQWRVNYWLSHFATSRFIDCWFIVDRWSINVHHWFIDGWQPILGDNSKNMSHVLVFLLRLLLVVGMSINVSNVMIYEQYVCFFNFTDWSVKHSCCAETKFRDSTKPYIDR